MRVRIANPRMAACGPPSMVVASLHPAAIGRSRDYPHDSRERPIAVLSAGGADAQELGERGCPERCLALGSPRPRTARSRRNR